ncbi:MAG: tetratricopeptide repeat protein [Candidatus Gastranaerophilales bacterium]
MKKGKLICLTVFLSLILALPVKADFRRHFDLGQNYLANYQYSSAITEFKNALRINYLDNSARIGLINAYCARGAYSANKEKDYKSAADDYRSALFYLTYYPDKNSTKNSTLAASQVTTNLNNCLSALKYDKTPLNRFNTAKQLRAEGEFAAAAYEFNQTLSDKTLIAESFEQTGDIMKLLGNNSKAIEYYRKALNTDPSDISLRMVYAQMLDKEDKFDLAIEEYNHVLSKTTDDKKVLYSLERIFKRKLEELPEDSTITNNLGVIMQKQGDYDEALRYYQKAEAIDPTNVNTRINVATLYQAKKDYKTAIKAYDSVLVLSSKNPELNLYKAQCLAGLGNKNEALIWYQKALYLDPTNVTAQVQIVEILKETMEPQEFVAYIKKHFSNINPTDVLYNYALDLHKNNKLSEAVVIYKELIRQNSTNPEIYANYAIALGELQNYNEATALLNDANKKFPGNRYITEAMTSIKNKSVDEKLVAATRAYNLKNYEKAIEIYLEIEPPTGATMLGVASSYQNLDDSNNAIVYYKKALELKPNDTSIAYYIAALYAENEDYTQAKIYTKIALSYDKTNTQAKELEYVIDKQVNSIDLGRAIEAFDVQDYDSCLLLLNDILRSEPSNSYALYYRGMVYDSQKRYSEAIEDYKKSLVSNSDLLILNYLIAVDCELLNKSQEALPYFKTFVSKYGQDDDFKIYANSRIEQLSDNMDGN